MERQNNRPVVFDGIGKSVLNQEQRRLAPLLEDFSATHFLWGGTAIALYLGHRKSIDFDFFSLAPQGTPRNFLQRLERFGDIIDNDAYFQEIVAMDMSGYTEEQDEYMIQALGTRCHFININRTLYKDQTITFHPQEYLQWGIRTIPLEELAGMKCFAMMYRNKWKDAVDVFFIMQKTGMLLRDIIAKAQEIYGSLYREECTYETIIKREWDKTEVVDYLIDTPPSDAEIEDFLVSEVNGILQEKIE